jgi:hypothetical protein
MATDTEDAGRLPEPERQPVLDPVHRVSEMLLGLFMALTFVGAISVAESGRAVLRSLLAAALGCNRAWGLVDAVMYRMRTDTERGRWITLLRSVRAAPDAAAGRRLVADSLSRSAARLVLDTAIEAICGRTVALPSACHGAGSSRPRRWPAAAGPAGSATARRCGRRAAAQAAEVEHGAGRTRLGLRPQEGVD